MAKNDGHINIVLADCRMISRKCCTTTKPCFSFSLTGTTATGFPFHKPEKTYEFQLANNALGKMMICGLHQHEAGNNREAKNDDENGNIMTKKSVVVVAAGCGFLQVQSKYKQRFPIKSPLQSGFTCLLLLLLLLCSEKKDDEECIRFCFMLQLLLFFII